MRAMELLLFVVLAAAVVVAVGTAAAAAAEVTGRLQQGCLAKRARARASGSGVDLMDDLAEAAAVTAMCEAIGKHIRDGRRMVL